MCQMDSLAGFMCNLHGLAECASGMSKERQYARQSAATQTHTWYKNSVPGS